MCTIVEKHNSILDEEDNNETLCSTATGVVYFGSSSSEQVVFKNFGIPR